MTCKTCKDAGHVPGRWMPELCPDCNGESAPHDVEPEPSVPWSLVFWILLPLVLVAIAQWGLWAFLLGVLG